MSGFSESRQADRPTRRISQLASECVRARKRCGLDCALKPRPSRCQKSEDAVRAAALARPLQPRFQEATASATPSGHARRGTEIIRWGSKSTNSTSGPRPATRLRWPHAPAVPRGRNSRCCCGPAGRLGCHRRLGSDKVARVPAANRAPALRAARLVAIATAAAAAASACHPRATDGNQAMQQGGERAEDWSWNKGEPS